MVNTHCLTSGALGSNELPCPGINGVNNKELIPAGSKRGVVVLMHGLDIVRIDPPYTLSGAFLTFAQGLQTDGWVVIVPPFPEDLFDSLPTQGLWNDVNADAGHGSRYLATTLHWWDHIIAYIQTKWGNWPVVPFGLSWGGWHAHAVAKNKLSTIKAFGTHEAVTTLSAVPLSFTTPVNFTSISTAGLDTAATDLNAVNVPGIIGWGTNDTVVGSSALSTLRSTAAAAGAPITSNATTDTHGWVAGDTTTYTSWFTGTVDPLCPAVF
jgi:dienelactone hydrolase